ncbi:Chromo domain protein [Kalmanozyma brasiliensis GHG001]|uniref:Chromo domain-containing protein n=1 Tax=Kalmanozyma brasiliensis (strain GHG001) TaxID=1365824 RepID=V5EE16_KALBG|nr:Chromo domain protein [Kalmanozyma brasiliensis GHG001]EST08716.1 Chromo domain protein [Kalmanozyma brasiliensis GHG001]
MSSAIAGPSASSSDDIDMPPASAPSPSTAAAISAALDSDSDAPEDEYEIEHIVSHSDITTDGQFSYYVKWKGYPESENSWVFESDMGGAQEMIKEYWAKVPKKSVKKMGVKKGKRHSHVGGSPEVKVKKSAMVEVKKAKRLAPSRSPTPRDSFVDIEDATIQRLRNDPTLSEEDRESLIAQHQHVLQIETLRKRYARIPDWDPIVRRIEAVEKTSNDKLRVFVLFNRGDRLAFEANVVHHRCPLKLLQFYEGNLRFKRREEGEGERREMRGEEDLSALEEYRKTNGEEEAVIVDDAATVEPGSSVYGDVVENGVNGTNGTTEAVDEVETEETLPAAAEVADEVSASAAIVDAQEDA